MRDACVELIACTTCGGPSDFPRELSERYGVGEAVKGSADWSTVEIEERC